MKTEREKFEKFICEYYPLTESIAKEKGLSIVDIHQAEWDAWQAAKADTVPEGYILMPKEPTNKIAQAMKNLDGRLSAFKCADLYKVAIEAQEQK